MLLEIAKQPIHGYQLASVLELPLSTVYGHLKDLKDMGLIAVEQGCSKIVYTPTQKGKTLIALLDE